MLKVICLFKPLGDESEEVATEGHEFFPCDSEGCETVEDFHNTLANALDPILIKYGWAGRLQQLYL